MTKERDQMTKTTKVCLLAVGFWPAFVFAVVVSAETLSTLPNYHKYSESLHSSGQPMRGQFADIRNEGVDVIVNLLPSNPAEGAIAGEKRVVEAAGMQYFHLPVSWKRPSIDHLKQFFSIMEGIQGRRVLVHCWVNARASAFVYLFRTLRQSEPEAQEQQVLRAIWANNKGLELRKVRQWKKFLRTAQNELK